MATLFDLIGIYLNAPAAPAATQIFAEQAIVFGQMATNEKPRQPRPAG
jgi:hypothetical protein